MREVPVPMTTLSVVLGSVAVWCHTTRETKLAVNTVLYVCYLFLHLSFAKKKEKNKLHNHCSYWCCAFITSAKKEMFANM